MTARMLALLLAMIGALVPCVAARADPAQAHRALAAASVVRLEIRYGMIFAPPGAGSGVVVGADGLIATTDHVLDGASEIWVLLGEERRHRARVITRAADRDLALLRVEDGQGLVPMAVRDRVVQPGQCVLALGNVMGWGIGVFAGIVSLSGCGDGCSKLQPHAILTDITTPPGLSGGALVTCAEHALVGIIGFGVVALGSPAATAGIVGAVPIGELAKLLRGRTACAAPSC